MIDIAKRWAVPAALAAARAVAYGLLGAVLVLICLAAMLWSKFGPQGFWILAWLGAVCVTVTGAVAAAEWAGKRLRAGGAYPEDWRERGWCCRECAVVAWYGMSLKLRRELNREA